jgi:flagellar biosynthetic protein FliQ
MTTDGALELFRNAVIAASQIAGPALVAALVVGLVIGVLQTATQVNEMSISFLTKLLAVCVAFGLAGPYILTKLVEYTRHTIGSISQVVR